MNSGLVFNNDCFRIGSSGEGVSGGKIGKGKKKKKKKKKSKGKKDKKKKKTG